MFAQVYYEECIGLTTKNTSVYYEEYIGLILYLPKNTSGMTVCPGLLRRMHRLPDVFFVVSLGKLSFPMYFSFCFVLCKMRYSYTKIETDVLFFSHSLLHRPNSSLIVWSFNCIRRKKFAFAWYDCRIGF